VSAALRHEVPQCAEPHGESLLLEVTHPFAALVARAIERRTPFHKGSPIGDHRRDADRRRIVLHREGRGIREGIGVGALTIRMGEQHLPDGAVRRADAAHRTDLVSDLAVLDHGLTLDAGPGIVIEGPDDRPYLVRRMIEHDAVIRSGHHCSSIA
jgi:hypothetical protein